MWLGVLGLLVCIAVGIVVSLVASHILKIHPVDLADHLDPNLFVPPVANHLKKRQQSLQSSFLRNGSSKEVPLVKKKYETVKTIIIIIIILLLSYFI